MNLNTFKGEVPLTCGADTYTLILSTNAMIALEEAFDISFVKFGSLLGPDMKVKDLVAMFAAMLQEHHEGLTNRDAGRIMDEVGMLAVMEAVLKAFELAMPDTEEKKPTGPQKAAKAASKPGKGSGKA